MNIEICDLFGAMVNTGADPYLIETEEQAEEMWKRIQAATSEREITDEYEFETATRQLDLQENHPDRIFSFVNGSEFLVCFIGDWHLFLL